MQCHIKATIAVLEKENERLERSNAELRRYLYFRRFITNPHKPDERTD